MKTKMTCSYNDDEDTQAPRSESPRRKKTEETQKKVQCKSNPGAHTQGKSQLDLNYEPLTSANCKMTRKRLQVHGSGPSNHPDPICHHLTSSNWIFQVAVDRCQRLLPFLHRAGHHEAALQVHAPIVEAATLGDEVLETQWVEGSR